MTGTQTATRPPEVTRQPVVLTAAVLIAIVVAVRTVLSLRGYLLGDDFAVRYRAFATPWSVSYAFEPYNDHISPVGYSLQSLMQWAFPGSHIALVLITSLLAALTLAAMAGFVWLATERLVAVVITTVVVGFGLFTFEVGTWWCTSLYSMTYLAFVAWSLWALARHQRRGASWVPMALGLLGAVLSDSKGFLAGLLVFGVAAGVDLTGNGALGLRRAWRTWRGVWWFTLALAVAALVLSSLTTSGVQGTLTVGRALAMMRDLWVVNIAPAVLGGPWWWSEVPNVEWAAVRVLPATGQALGWLCLAVCVAGLIFIVRRRPAIAGFVPYALAYCVVTTAIPVVGRAGTNLSSAAYRYTYDVVLPVAILLTLALVPMWWQQVRTRPSLWLVPVALSVSMAVSTWVPAQAWARNEAKQYVSNAVAGFPTIPEGQTVITQGVPKDLVPDLLWNYASTQAVLSPQPGAPQFSTYADDTLFGFARDGAVEKQEVQGPRAVPGPDPECGYRITSTPRSVPLEAELIDWGFMARVAYFTDATTDLHMAVGRDIHSVPLQKDGLRAVYFPVWGPGRDVLLSVDGDAVVCVTELTIGNRVHPGTGEAVALTPGPLE